MNRQTIWVVNQHWQDINPLQCGWEQCTAGHSFGPAIRNFYLLHYVLSGCGDFAVRGVDTKIQKGQIFIIHPQELTFYKADENDPWQYIWIGFESNIKMPEVLQKSVISAPELHGTFLRLKTIPNFPEGSERLLCGIIWEILGTLQQMEVRQVQTCVDYAMQALTFLDTHFMTKISISDLAKQMHVDRSYLCRLFRKYVGMSPRQYLTELRLHKALLMMIEQKYTLAEAAFCVGYADTASFSRAFRERYGMSPGKYCRERTNEV